MLGGLPCPTPEGLSYSGIEAVSRVAPSFEGRFFTTEPRGKPCIYITLDSSKVRRHCDSYWGSFPFLWTVWGRKEPHHRCTSCQQPLRAVIQAEPQQPAALTPRYCCGLWSVSFPPGLTRSRRAEPATLGLCFCSASCCHLSGSVPQMQTAERESDCLAPSVCVMLSVSLRASKPQSAGRLAHPDPADSSLLGPVFWERNYLFWLSSALNSLGTSKAMKLEDACPLEEKLWPK